MKSILIISNTSYLFNFPCSFRTTELVKNLNIKEQKGTVLIYKEDINWYFLLNFEDPGYEKILTKLIDYTIIRKSFLKVNSIKFEQETSEEFIEANYDNVLYVTNKIHYRNEKEAEKSLNLLKD